jgi:DNA-binding CsgD family transcriptional regulator
MTPEQPPKHESADVKAPAKAPAKTKPRATSTWSLHYDAREHRVPDKGLVLGRGHSADLHVEDDQVSRRHALLRVDGDRPVVMDLRSRNGTYVNGSRIVGAVCLSPGDRIVIGSCELLLSRSEDAQGDASPDGATKPMRPLSPEGSRTAAALLSSLSRRELETFSWLARGVSLREIAQSLGVSVKTIETHRTHIGQKLGLRTRADLVRFALESGVLQVPPRPSTDEPLST